MAAERLLGREDHGGFLRKMTGFITENDGVLLRKMTENDGFAKVQTEWSF